MAKRKRRKNNIPLIIMVLILGIALIGAVVYIITDKYMSKNPKLSGEYRTAIDITDEINSNVALYLSTVQGVEISAADIDENIGNVKVNLLVNITNMSNSQGSFEIAVDEESLSQANEQVYLGLGNILKNVIAQRLDKVGYDVASENTDVDEIVNNALGKDIDQYLKECELAIVPTAEDIMNMVGDSGDYLFNDDILTITVDEESKDYSYIYDDKLAITDIPMILEKNEAKEVQDEENN